MTLGEYIGQKVREAFAGAIKDEKDDLTDISVAGGDAAAGGFLGKVGRFTDIITGIIGDIPIVGSIIDAPLKLLSDAEDAGGKLGTGFGSGYFLGYAAFQLLDPYIRMIQHGVENLAQSMIFDPATAAHLVARGIIEHGYGASEAAGGGFDGGHFSQMIEAEKTFPAAAELLTMWNLGQISEADVDNALTRNGVSQRYWPAIKASRRNFLSSADLALATLRGEMPQDQAAAYAQILGMETGDFDVLIQNTGEPPGLMQLLEAYRRGFIDQERLDRGIRQSRVRNEWIDVVNKLRLSPMSTADAARAVVENYMTSEQGASIAEQNGLEPAHWPVILESWGRPLSHEQMLTLYHRGQVTLEQVRQAMKESDIKDKYIDPAIELGRHLVPERTIVSMLGHGVLDHPTALQMLKEQGFNDVDAENLIKLGTAQHTSTHKELSRSDLIAMYRDSLLTRQQARDHIMALGYSETDAVAMLDLSDVKARSTELRTLERGIEASLKAHHLTKEQALDQLAKAGLDPQQASMLVDQWLQQRGTATHSLTESQILQLGTKKFITPDDTRNRLVGVGLVPGDVELLLELHGIVPKSA